MFVGLTNKNIGWFLTLFNKTLLTAKEVCPNMILFYLWNLIGASVSVW